MLAAHPFSATATSLAAGNVSATGLFAAAAFNLAATPSLSPSYLVCPRIRSLSVAAVDVCCRCFAVRADGMDRH